MATVQLVDVSKVYPDGYLAAKHVDLSIADGELHVIVGPSGCGKTTVLRMVAGLEDATDGEIRIDDVRVNEVKPRDRNVAMAFQEHALYPHMTVAENLGFPLKVSGTPVDEIAAHVRRVARLLHLDDVLDHRPRRLSGGQQQRVSLGRSIIRSPRLFLMDEPLSHLDARLRVESRAEIMRIQRRVGVTTIFVTHDQVEAMAIGDTVTIMRDGVVVQSGPPARLYTRPVDLFVAQFIGSPPMNVLAGTIGPGRDAEHQAVTIGSHSLQIRRTELDEHAHRRVDWSEFHDRRIGVGLRPETLRRTDRGPLVTSVESATALGSNQLVEAVIDAPSVTLDGDTVEIGESRSSTITVFVDDQQPVSLWEPFTLEVDTADLHLFDLDTGLALR